MLDDHVVASYEGVRRFLVHWKGHPASSVTWITKVEFRHLDAMLFDAYLDYTSSKSSSFQPGEE